MPLTKEYYQREEAHWNSSHLREKDPKVKTHYAELAKKAASNAAAIAAVEAAAVEAAEA